MGASSAISFDAWLREGVAFRHELHRHPELTWKERETAGRIRAQLDALGIPWTSCAETGTLGRLAPRAKGEHVALRADIDALPIREKTGAPWASVHDGCMHACGHDGHTATLMLAARWLKAHEDALPGPVTLIFQPAEEGGHGAVKMIEGGALAGVDSVFGWHNWPSLPFGQVLCPDRVVMAGNGTYDLDVIGEGGHASQPDRVKDPVLAASAIVMALQQILNRRIPTTDLAVVIVTSIVAPSAYTVVPSRARIGGSFRYGRPELLETIERSIVEIAEQTALAYGTRCEVTMHRRYDPTVNHPAEAARYRAVLAEELGCTIDPGAPPLMASEDFGYYLQERPGAFALIGAGSDEATRRPCHHEGYDFNDALIPHVVRAFARVVGAPVPPPLEGERRTPRGTDRKEIGERQDGL
ncbi:MAG: N(2)-acetyl-L-2,4-diaminobutanoate deacetylase DoeB2 [Sandaracinaceae bacterium]